MNWKIQGIEFVASKATFPSCSTCAHLGSQDGVSETGAAATRPGEGRGPAVVPRQHARSAGESCQQLGSLDMSEAFSAAVVGTHVVWGDGSKSHLSKLTVQPKRANTDRIQSQWNSKFVSGEIMKIKSLTHTEQQDCFSLK